MLEQGLQLQARQHGDLHRGLGMTNRLWGAVKVAMPVLFCLGALGRVIHDHSDLGFKVAAPTLIREGDIIDLKAILSQSADKQTISTPEMKGMSAELDSYEATGSGAFKTNLSTLVPTGSLQLKNKVVMSAQGQTMKMGLDLKVDVGTK